MPAPTPVVIDTTDRSPAPHIIVLTSVRKHWLTAVLVLITVFLVALFYTLGAKRIYRAEATIKFDPRPPRALGSDVEGVVDMGVGTWWNNQEYYETQYNIITSRRVAELVVDQLALHRDGTFLANLPPDAGEVAADATKEQAADALRSRLSVEPVKDSRLAQVRLEDANPERAAKILNVLVNTYIELNILDAYGSTDRAITDLSGQLEKLEDSLRESEEALYDFRKENNILSVALDDQSNMLRGEMDQLNHELTRVRAQAQEASARRTELASIEADPTKLPSRDLLDNALLRSLRQDYIDGLRQYEGVLASGKGKNHPEARQIASRNEEVKKALLAEVANVKASADAELRILGRQEGGLNSLFERAKSQALELNQLEIEYNRRKREKENQEKLYELVLNRTKESGLSRTTMLNNISVIDRARVPKAAILPKVPLNLGGGMVLGIVLGVAAALARGLMDRTIKTPEDVEEELGVTSLGLLPTIGETSSYAPYYGRKGKPSEDDIESPELIVHTHPRSGVAEAARAVRTNLTFMAADEPFHAMLVTSAGPAEGKTTVACCIAIAMAQAGHRVAVIDCDLRRPRVHRVFDMGSDVGVTTALLDGDLDSAEYTTGIPNLTAIAAGPIPPNPAELFHTEKFKQLLGELRSRYDRVVIDSPPVVAVTDATILSTLVDATVLVVRAQGTKKDAAKHAIRSMRMVGARIAGCVLNAVDLTRSEYRGSYYYYHRKQYGEDAADA